MELTTTGDQVHELGVTDSHPRAELGPFWFIKEGKGNNYASKIFSGLLLSPIFCVTRRLYLGVTSILFLYRPLKSEHFPELMTFVPFHIMALDFL